MSNRDLPMMPWYPDQFEASTADWSFAEASLYRRLLDAQWQLGSLPAEKERLARICKLTLAEFDPLWKVVAPKFSKGRGAGLAGRLINKRLEYHRVKAMERKDHYAQAGSKGGQATAQAKAKRRSSNAASIAQRTPPAKSKPPTPTPTPTPLKSQNPPPTLGTTAPPPPGPRHATDHLQRISTALKPEPKSQNGAAEHTADPPQTVMQPPTEKQILAPAADPGPSLREKVRSLSDTGLAVGDIIRVLSQYHLTQAQVESYLAESALP
jgi:uncharacterized protein YdaU (DUF1376 family)